MRVQLNEKGEGSYKDGPKPGAVGECLWIDSQGSQIFCAVKFEGFDEGVYYVMPTWLFHKVVSEEGSYYTTFFVEEKQDDADDHSIDADDSES